jgi:hypothetical protein
VYDAAASCRGRELMSVIGESAHRIRCRRDRPSLPS